jgi:hypothetical protein
VLYYASPSNSKIIEAIDKGLLGAFHSPRSHAITYRKAAWCADNGCFSGNYVGNEEYLKWLSAGREDVSRCAFATAPDVLCQAMRTLRRSLPMLPRIRKLGYPAALVAQNGLEQCAVPWDEFDVFFIGGDTKWKLGKDAARLVREAKARGKHVHMGRVNGLRRLRHALDIGCDSVDGNTLTYGIDINLPRLLSWLEDVNGPGGVVCVMCGERFRPVRLDAKTCGARCRKRLERARAAAKASLCTGSLGRSPGCPHVQSL